MWSPRENKGEPLIIFGHEALRLGKPEWPLTGGYDRNEYSISERSLSTRSAPDERRVS